MESYITENSVDTITVPYGAAGPRLDSGFLKSGGFLRQHLTEDVLSVSGSYWRGPGREVRGSHFYFSKKLLGVLWGIGREEAIRGMEGRHERC